LDATKIDPATLRFAGAGVETRGHHSFQISTQDRDGNGRPDLIAHFKTEELRLTRADTEGVLEGRTFDNRLIPGRGESEDLEIGTKAEMTGQSPKIDCLGRLASSGP